MNNVSARKGPKSLISALLTAILLIQSLLLFGCGEEPVNPLVKASALVMLSCDSNVTVIGDNPQKVALGEDAVFEVEFAEGKTADTLENCEYEDGKIVVRNVKVPVTATVTSRDTVKYRFFTDDGVKSSVDQGLVYEGTEITVTAPDTKTVDGEERMFIGYTVGKSLTKGGTVVSYSSTYTFTLTGDCDLYVNYAHAGAKIIVYNANGGKTSGGKSYLAVESTDTAHTCPNALPNKGDFVREGYVLAGYNTEADGSGRFYGCGWNVVFSDTSLVQLYCVWMEATPASDFTYAESGTNVSIKKYNGNADTVVIPETINGKNVTTITAKAFNGKDMTSLFISKNVTTVAVNAIYNCKNLETLYVCDTLTGIKDESINGCDNYSTLIVEACTSPKYQTSRNGNYQNKYERLITAESPKLVIVSGSNSAYGVNSPLLEELLDNQYNVVNYGNHQNAPVILYIEIATAWAGEGDIIVHNPESFSQWQHGYNQFSTTVWQYAEGCYGCISVVDIRHYSSVLSTFADYCSSRKSRADNTYESVSSETVNLYGDYSATKVGQVYTPGYNSHAYNGASTFKYAENLNAAYKRAQDAGIRVYMSFGVINEATLTASSRTAAVQEEYVKLREATFTPTAFISEISTYIMDNKYFYNADYHVTSEGAEVRTRNLAKDILAQLAKEAQK